MQKSSIEHKSVPMIRSAITGLTLLVVVVVAGVIGYMTIEATGLSMLSI
ncbi:MAG: hypothetical protein R2744_05900 [Bacteroidales bacterium]